MSAVLVVAGLSVAVPVGWALVSHHLTTKAERRDALRETGEALGLTFGMAGERSGAEQRFVGLDGVFEGARVSIDLVPASQQQVPRGAPRNAPRPPALRTGKGTRMHVYFPTSLALGIPPSVADGIGAALGSPLKTLRSLGDVGSRLIELAGLLESSGMKSALGARGMHSALVTDERLTVYIDPYRAIVTEAEIRPALVAGTKAMQKLYEARWSLPVGAREAAQRRAMKALAARLALELGRGDLSASGPYRGGDLLIECGFDGLEPITRLRYAGRALPFRLRLAEDSLRATLMREQDIHVGDEAFDRRFLVQGAPEESVRLVFDEAVRARVWAVWEAAHRLSVDAQVRYENGGFTVRWPGRLTANANLLPIARAFADATDAMLATQRSAPYR